VTKTYIKAGQLYLDAFRLGRKIWADGFRPDIIVGIWRGGTPPGIAIHEFFKIMYEKHSIDKPIYHTAIKTQSYTNIMESGIETNSVEVFGIQHVIEKINSTDKLLIVDDVWERGLTIVKVLDTIKTKARRNCPENIKVATVYFKPAKNLTKLAPDYFVTIDNKWLVYPHELHGLSEAEIKKKSQIMFGSEELVRLLGE